MPLVANNAASRLATSIGAADTTISLQAGTGSVFPAPSGDWFPITLIKPSGEFEIAHCTARTNDVLTVVRGRESTSGKAFSAGDRVEVRLTAGTLGAMIEGVRLPYTPVQQGGGAGQTASKVYIGWNGSALTAQIEGLDYGTLWSSYNFNPASYMPVAGGTFNGKVYTASISGAMAQNDQGAALEVRSANGATGETGLAMISFHCQGSYAAKIGLRADGYFGFGGWSRPAWQFYSASNGDFISAGNVGAYSDPRLKDDVERIEGALAIVEQLDGVRFTWNHVTSLIGKPGERDIGVLADQVEAVLPEIVGRSIPDDANNGERWRVVAYDKLVPVLLEAVKELHGRVRLLERA